MLKAPFVLPNLIILFFNLGSHRQGPGEQVDQGLVEVHHDPKVQIFILNFLEAYESSAIVDEKVLGC